jgi:hypothetical protein
LAHRQAKQGVPACSALAGKHDPMVTIAKSLAGKENPRRIIRELPAGKPD